MLAPRREPTDENVVGLIAHETIDKVVAATDVVDLIGSYFPLKRAGSNFIALCPFHREKTPSFHVNPARQTFHCFGCGVGGGVIHFVMTYENLDYPSAIRRLADRANIPVIEEEGSSADSGSNIRRRLVALHHETADWLHQNLLRLPAAAHAREYLQKRGLNIDTAREWRIGYAPSGWNTFSDWATERGYSREELLASGLAKTRDAEEDESAPRRIYDRFRDRIMFPICNEQGDVVAFSGRVLQADAPGGKYINSPETPIFIKGAILFGLHKTRRSIADVGQAVVCEGQIDLISAYRSGVTNLVAPQGTAFTPRQAMILRRFAPEVILCFDSDTAGRKAAERSFGALLEAGLTVRVAEMPPGEDPDSLIRAQGPEAFRTLIAAARDYFDFLMDRYAAEFDLATHSGKARFAETIAAALAQVPNPVYRSSVAARAAARLGVAEEQFRSMIRPPRADVPDAAPATKQPEDPMLSTLAALALKHPKSRAWILGRDWRGDLRGVPGTELLETILAAPLAPETEASTTAWLATLDAENASRIAALLDTSLTANDSLLEKYWQGLPLRALSEEIRRLEASARKEGIPFEEELAIRQQILDKRRELLEIRRLLC